MICAVVLAAGRSERMGTQKLLLPLQGRTIIGGIVDELVNSPLEAILVVTGREAGRIQQALAGRQVSFVSNPEPAGDMLSSVRCGLRTLPAGCDAVVVVLGDQPGLRRGLVMQLLRAYRRTNCGIVVPAHSGRRGHPLLFATRFSAEVLSRFDGIGLRGLLAAHPKEIHEVPTTTAAELQDMDTPEDYRQQLKPTTI